MRLPTWRCDLHGEKVGVGGVAPASARGSHQNVPRGLTQHPMPLPARFDGAGRYPPAAPNPQILRKNLVLKCSSSYWRNAVYGTNIVVSNIVYTTA